jgi:hypothetical protein
MCVWNCPEERAEVPRQETATMTDQPGFGSAAHHRIAHKSKILSRMVNRCSKRELEMLIRYYIRGQDEQRVITEMGCTAEEFEKLRVKMRRSVIQSDPPKRRAASAN